MKVLVAYASKYGSTKGIAEFIGEKLRERGVEADVLEVSAAKDLAGYDAFIVGSAAYMTHWLKEASGFLSHNQDALSSRPVWLFSSGPVGTETKDAKGRDVLEASEPQELPELKAKVRARGHQVFFGALYADKLTGFAGFGYRMARKIPAARQAMPEGDFRDWKKIEAWVESIALDLKSGA